MAERHWSKPLSRSVRLKSGRELVTLRDAGEIILSDEFSGVTYSDAIVHAVELLMRAARTGRVADRQAATDQVEIVLRWRGLM